MSRWADWGQAALLMAAAAGVCRLVWHVMNIPTGAAW